MRLFTSEVVIEREVEDEGHSAYSPTVPGCFSTGKTIAEANRNICGAVQQHIATLVVQGH